MALNTAKEVRVMFDQVTDLMEEEFQMAGQVDSYDVDPATMQNSSNIIWRPVEQHAPVQSGWDMTGKFGNIIEQYYPCQLEDPRNDAFGLRADDFRDRRFMERRGRAAAKKLSADQNKRIAELVASTGSLFSRTSTAGYDFLATPEAIMDERQVASMTGRSFFLNPRDHQAIASDLANRGTLSGRPEGAYARSMVGRDVAGFDVYRSSYLPTLAGGATPAGATVGTTVSLKPEGLTTVGGVNVNVDYRVGEIELALGDGADFSVGDRISFTGVKALGLLDKTNTGQDMTFTIVGIDTDTISVYPKPIALTDAALTDAEKAYANIATQITAGTAVVRLNTDTLAQTNVFWANDSVEIIGGSAPLSYLGQLDGMEVMESTLTSGTKLYMAYQGSIDDFSLKCRLFTWYGLCNKRPDANGIAILA